MDFASLGGGILGAGMSLIGQNSQNQFNAGQAQDQRNFQEQMSNTAYQRATADMEKAGLNPAMMYGSGSAASTPQGGMAQETQNPGQAAALAASSSASAIADVQNKQGQNAVNAESINTQKTQQGVNQTTALKNIADAANTNLQNKGTSALWSTIDGGINSALQGVLRFRQNAIDTGKKNLGNIFQTTPLYQKGSAQ